MTSGIPPPTTRGSTEHIAVWQTTTKLLGSALGSTAIWLSGQTTIPQTLQKDQL